MNYRLISTALILASLTISAVAQDTVQGVLNAKNIYQSYRFELTEKTNVEFLAESDDLDVALSLMKGFQEVQFASNISIQNTNAKMAAQLDPGVYHLLVVPEKMGKGKFTLQGKQFNKPSGEITLNHLGDLASSSEVLPEIKNSEIKYPVSKSKAITYSLTVPDHTELEVTVFGLNQMDTTLHVLDSNGNLLGESQYYNYSDFTSRVLIDDYQGEVDIIVSSIAPNTQSEFIVTGITRTENNLRAITLGPADQKFLDSINEMIASQSIDTDLTGTVAPDFSISTFDGESIITLSEQKGKVVFIDFWEPWCKPCLVGMPKLQQLHEEFGTREDFVIYGIVGGEKDLAQQATEATKVKYLQLHRKNNEVMRDYRIRPIPRMILVGKDGKIVNDWTGLYPYKTLEAAVLKALGE